jgi:hypothetical protein
VRHGALAMGPGKSEQSVTGRGMWDEDELEKVGMGLGVRVGWGAGYGRGGGPVCVWHSTSIGRGGRTGRARIISSSACIVPSPP